MEEKARKPNCRRLPAEDEEDRFGSKLHRIKWVSFVSFPSRMLVNFPSVVQTGLLSGGNAWMCIQMKVTNAKVFGCFSGESSRETVYNSAMRHSRRM